MNIKSLALVTLLLSSASAFAGEQKLATVEVRPESRLVLTFDCASPAAARPLDVERVLKINDRTQTNGLSHKLKSAVIEACSAGADSIVVQRAASGRSLTWAPAREIAQSVASN